MRNTVESIVSQIVDVAALWNAAELRIGLPARSVPVYARMKNIRIATVADFVEAEDGFLYTEFFGGRAYHAAVVCVGRDPDQANSRLCMSLHEDVERLATMTDFELQTRLSEKPSPIRRVRINAAPTLTALFDAPAHMLGANSIDEVESRARRMKDDENLRARFIAAYVASREPYPLSPHIEERIYNGFPGPNDEARIGAFHEASWPDRFAIVQNFEDERLRWFGLRLIYFEARSVLPASARAGVEGRLASQLAGDGTGALTYEQALAETDKLLEGTTDSDGLLSQYRRYLQERSVRAAAFRAREVA